MAAVIARLIAIAALMLMPLGMGNISAAPAPAHHDRMPAAHGEEHGNHQQQPADMSRQAHCAMCVALPVADMPRPAPRTKADLPRATGPGVAFVGIEPELATPPPKLG